MGKRKGTTQKAKVSASKQKTSDNTPTAEEQNPPPEQTPETMYSYKFINIY